VASVADQAQKIRERDLFRINAIGDKLLVDGKIRYLMFFEADEPYRGGAYWDWNRRSDIVPWKVFKTPNGFHVINSALATPQGKRFWFETWKRRYKHSDYLLDNTNWLAPHSEEELDFIVNLCTNYGVFPNIVRYYRDKAVFETLETS
jgi:hypothetical protein